MSNLTEVLDSYQKIQGEDGKVLEAKPLGDVLGPLSELAMENVEEGKGVLLYPEGVGVSHVTYQIYEGPQVDWSKGMEHPMSLRPNELSRIDGVVQAYDSLGIGCIFVPTFRPSGMGFDVYVSREKFKRLIDAEE